MFSFRRDKMGFIAGIVLMTIASGTFISTLVLVTVGLAQGDWARYLLPVKWILGSAWVLCVTLVISLIANRGGSTDGGVPGDGTRERPIGITSVQLVRAYEANEVGADQRYKDKWLEVQGTVHSISKTFGTLFVHLEGDGLFSTVQCSFGGEHLEEIARLAKGERVKIKGRCFGQVLTFMSMRDCEFAP